jgi:outer membrane protein assembly factor BamB
VKRLGALTFAALACAPLALAAACGGGENGTAPKVDAGAEASLFQEAGPPDAAPEPGPGDPCGDASGFEQTAPWPARGGCPKRAGYASFGGPRNAVTKWSVAVSAGDSSPAIDASRVVWVGTSGGDVLGFSTSGIAQGGAHTGAAVTAGAAIDARGVTIVGSTDGFLYGVVRGSLPSDAGADADADADASAPQGSIVLQKAIAPTSSSPVIAPDGTIYLGTTDGKLLALGPDGSPKWSVTTNDTGGSSPAIGQGGTVYVGSTDKHLYAIGPDGTVLWSYDTGASIAGSPVVGGDDAVYVGAADGKLYALEPAGTLRWSYTAGGAINGSPAVFAGSVYVGSDDKKLHAVATLTGAEKWTYATLGAVATPVIDREGYVFFGSADGHVYALTPGGSLFFAVNAKGAIKSAPALSDDGTLFVTTSNALVAIGP